MTQIEAFKHSLYLVDYIHSKMKPNNNVPTQKFTLGTPNTFLTGARARLHSFNTPQLSPLPLRMIQSPYPFLGDGSIFENQLILGGQFKLEEEPLVQDNVEQVQQSSDESVEEIQFPKFPKDGKVTKDNMIEFLVDSVNTNEDRINEVKNSFEQSGPPFLAEVFVYLYKRFKKVKKTKEEMIKYTMRKSFKYITDQLKKEDPSLIPLLSTDGLQGMSIYFQKHSEDQDISIPFKKNSLQKTMNTNFLKKVFAVYRFYKDYKKFLKTFQNQFLKDNLKKISTMNEAVKQCLVTKNFKSLQNFKRLPWTKDILIKLKQFSCQLLSYSPYSKDGAQRPAPSAKEQEQKYAVKMDLSVEHQKPAPKRSIDSLNYDDLINNDFDDDKDGDNLIQQHAKPSKKKSVIILTPVAQTLNSPKIPDLFSLE